MLLEKSSEERLVFSVTMSEQAVTLRYGQSRSQSPLTVSFRTEGRLTLDKWTHLVLQVTNLNGLGILVMPVEHAVVSHMIMSMYIYTMCTHRCVCIYDIKSFYLRSTMRFCLRE